MPDAAVQSFKNSDLKQIYTALQEGNIAGALEIIANGVNVTNNLVSVTAFTGDTMADVLVEYNTWLDENPDWTVLNETMLTANTEGIIYLFIRYKGEKVPA